MPPRQSHPANPTPTAIEGYVRAGATSLASRPVTFARLRAEHRAIVAAIEAGDSQAARTLVHSHIAG